MGNRLAANNVGFYFDYQNGEYGFNTSELRGADTFSPFKSESGIDLKNCLICGGYYYGTNSPSGYHGNATIIGGGIKLIDGVVSDPVYIYVSVPTNERVKRFKWSGGTNQSTISSYYITALEDVTLMVIDRTTHYKTGGYHRYSKFKTINLTKGSQYVDNLGGGSDCGNESWIYIDITD